MGDYDRLVGPVWMELLPVLSRVGLSDLVEHHLRAAVEGCHGLPGARRAAVGTQRSSLARGGLRGASGASPL